jgi:hypothetical protein
MSRSFLNSGTLIVILRQVIRWQWTYAQCGRNFTLRKIGMSMLSMHRIELCLYTRVLSMLVLCLYWVCLKCRSFQNLQSTKLVYGDLWLTNAAWYCTYTVRYNTISNNEIGRSVHVVFYQFSSLFPTELDNTIIQYMFFSHVLLIELLLAFFLPVRGLHNLNK